MFCCSHCMRRLQVTVHYGTATLAVLCSVLSITVRFNRTCAETEPPPTRMRYLSTVLDVDYKVMTTIRVSFFCGSIDFAPRSCNRLPWFRAKWRRHNTAPQCCCAGSTNAGGRSRNVGIRISRYCANDSFIDLIVFGHQ